MIGSTLSRRTALVGLVAAPALGLVSASGAASLCGGQRSGAVQASGTSTVCDFVTQTVADGSVSIVSFSDFKIAEVRAGTRVEQLFAAYHTFAAPAGASARLGRVALDGAFDSQGVSGSVRVDARVGALSGRRTWRIEDDSQWWTFGLEGRRQSLRPGDVFPITIKVVVRVASFTQRGLFSLSVDGLTYAHA